MSEDVPILGIPALRENPFKARPLERGQSDLLVARDEISARWSRFLRNRNARMILLIGERGSGRSSLMRCVSEETSRSVHLDMFPTGNHAHSILNELFVTLIGFDVPSSTQELASRLVSATEEIEGPIPLISLDFSNVDGKNLSEIMSNLIAPLERLNAVVVVALSTEQRAQWPNNLVNRFDHNDVIQPLDRLHVKELCELRIAKSSKVSWDLPDKALDYIMEETKGSPYKVMRLMRNMVDEERANPREMKYEEPEPQNFQEEITQIEQEQEEEPEPEVFEKVFDLDLEKLEAPPESFEAIPRPLPSMGAFGAFAGKAVSFGAKGIGFSKAALGAKAAFGIGAALVLSGVSDMLFPMPKMPEFKSEQDPKLSYGFGGTQNTSRAGTPVPVVYGEIITGSVVISGAIDTQQVRA